MDQKENTCPLNVGSGFLFGLSYEFSSPHMEQSSKICRGVGGSFRFVSSFSFTICKSMTDKYRNYLTYLKSDHWNHLRKSKYRQAKMKCQVCFEGGVLHCHHIRYRNLTDCTLDDLACLCAECHDAFHVACKHYKIESENVELADISSILVSFEETDAFQRLVEKRIARQKSKAAKPFSSEKGRRKRAWCMFEPHLNRFSSSKRTATDLQVFINEISKLTTLQVFQGEKSTPTNFALYL